MNGLLKYLLQPFKSTKSTLAAGSLVGLLFITAVACYRWDRELIIILIPTFTMVFIHYFKKDGEEVVSRPEDYVDEGYSRPVEIDGQGTVDVD